MNYRILIAPFVLAGLMLGCQSNKPTNDHLPVVQSIASVQKQLANTSQQVQRVDALLGEFQTSTDLKGTLTRFQSAVKDLTASAAQARELGQGMRESRDEYISQWIKEIQQIGDLNKQDKEVYARQQVQAHFDKIADLAHAARTSFGPYLAGLDDINVALSADTTASRVQTIAPSITRTKADGQQLSKDITALSAELNTLKGSIEPLKPAN